MTTTVLEFLRNGKLLKQINATMISLIPKVKNPLSFSYCNVLYKCIFKVLYVKLRKSFSILVTENQAAFVGERSLVHNILICHDLMRHYNRKHHLNAL